MCDAMSKSHHRVSMTMSHRVLTLVELSANPQLHDQVVVQVCKDHGKPLELFDLKCGRLLCAICVLDHAAHADRVRPIPEAAALCRIELGEWASRLDVHVGRVRATLQANDARGTEVEAAHDRAADKINATFDQAWIHSFRA